MNQCMHVDEDGNFCIKFPKKIKVTNVYPRLIQGKCKLCGETIKFTPEEYFEIMNGGE